MKTDRLSSWNTSEDTQIPMFLRSAIDLYFYSTFELLMARFELRTY